MIVMELAGIQWGTDAVPGNENARQLNMRDEESGMILKVIFGDEPLEKLILELSQGLTDEQIKDVRDKLTERHSGIVMPNGNGPAKKPPAKKSTAKKRRS